MVHSIPLLKEDESRKSVECLYLVISKVFGCQQRFYRLYNRPVRDSDRTLGCCAGCTCQLGTTGGLHLLSFPAPLFHGPGAKSTSRNALYFPFI